MHRNTTNETYIYADLEPYKLENKQPRNLYAKFSSLF